MIGSIDKIHPDLLDILKGLEEHIDFELTITSGHRDIEHNDKVGGVKDSEHTYNPAEGVDVLCRQSITRHQMLEWLYSKKVSRIGIGDHFLHIGVADDKPQRVTWTYYPEREA